MNRWSHPSKKLFLMKKPTMTGVYPILDRMASARLCLARTGSGGAPQGEPQTAGPSQESRELEDTPYRFPLENFMSRERFERIKAFAADKRRPSSPSTST